MQAFTLTEPADLAAASAAGRADGAAFIAGGTDMMQLLHDDVVRPSRLIDIQRLDLRRIAATPDGLRLGALASMSEVAANADVRRGWPAIAEALLASASPQIRNMGTMGGNLLQRTRCLYFRDTGSACNKREPGTGCPARSGENRDLAVLGGSAHCIATHPSDMPVALMAFDASVELHGADGQARTVKLRDFYRLPGETPQDETVLQPGDLITAIEVPASLAAAHATYIKVRDRASFAFALVSLAVGLAVRNGTIQDARVAFGGVAPMPWRADAAEAALRSQPAQAATFEAAAARAADGASPASQNGFKPTLMQRTLSRALQSLSA